MLHKLFTLLGLFCIFTVTLGVSIPTPSSVLENSNPHTGLQLNVPPIDNTNQTDLAAHGICSFKAHMVKKNKDTVKLELRHLRDGKNKGIPDMSMPPFRGYLELEASGLRSGVGFGVKPQYDEIQFLGGLLKGWWLRDENGKEAMMYLFETLDKKSTQEWFNDVWWDEKTGTGCKRGEHHQINDGTWEYSAECKFRC